MIHSMTIYDSLYDHLWFTLRPSMIHSMTIYDSLYDHLWPTLRPSMIHSTTIYGHLLYNTLLLSIYSQICVVTICVVTIWRLYEDLPWRMHNSEHIPSDLVRFLPDSVLALFMSLLAALTANMYLVFGSKLRTTYKSCLSADTTWIHCPFLSTFLYSTM